MATTVTFFSKFTELRLTRQPAVDVPLPNGTGWIAKEKGLRYQFQPAPTPDGEGLIGVLHVKVGQDRLQDSQGWLHPDADTEVVRDAVEALCAHREFGRDFWKADIPAKEIRARIRKALAELDTEALEALMVEERGNNARADLIAEAQDALDLVNEQRANIAAMQAEAEAEQAAPKAKPKPKPPAA